MRSRIFSMTIALSTITKSGQMVKILAMTLTKLTDTEIISMFKILVALWPIQGYRGQCLINSISTKSFIPSPARGKKVFVTNLNRRSSAA